MGLKALNLKSAYYSDEDNLLLDFYVPVLSKSISYKRIAGYFSSNSLAVAARGISEFINNGGKVKLIANVVLSLEDQVAIKEAISIKEAEIINEIYDMEDTLKKDHIRMLGWLIMNKALEIKIAVVRKGVEHQKIGLLEDSEGDTISFSGSDNETAYGWLHNDEQFHVFCSWKEGDSEHLLSDSKRFDRLWENKGNKVRVFDVSEAFKNGLVKTAPRDNEEFNNLSARTIDALLEENNRIYGHIKIKEKPLSFIDNLWYFQKDAIDNWERNAFKGIFSMATGTGKTKTAIGGIIKLKNFKERLFAVISSPQNTILKQWEKEIKNIGLFNASIIADSTNNSWDTQLADKVIDYNEGNINSCVVFTTYNTLSSDRFINIISDLSGPSLLVGDEVHWAGASTFRKGLAQTYEFRLGLSATPKRYMDEEGTDEIINYFGDVVYEFSLERALTEINPITKKTFLCPYNYYPLFVNLNEDELAEYYELTGKINRQFAKESKYESNSDHLQRLCEKRQSIIVNADKKYESLNTLLDSLIIIKFLFSPRFAR